MGTLSGFGANRDDLSGWPPTSGTSSDQPIRKHQLSLRLYCGVKYSHSTLVLYFINSKRDRVYKLDPLTGLSVSELLSNGNSVFDGI